MTSPPVTIITGASSGIGRELAIQYAQQGHSLGLIARRHDALLDLQTHLMDTWSVPVVIRSVSVHDAPAITTAIHDIIHHFGRVDCLIANAGVAIPSPADTPSMNDLKTTMDTNVLGSGYSAYAVIPTMMAQRSGHIVAISSLAGYRGMPKSGSYCASKAAVNVLFESMRMDVAPYGIHVSVIRPGFIRSPITHRNEFYMPWLLSTEDGAKKIRRAIQKKRAIYSFPTPLAMVVKTFYFWPCWLYQTIFCRVTIKKTR